jgi:hypothetical protein
MYRPSRRSTSHHARTPGSEMTLKPGRALTGS